MRFVLRKPRRLQRDGYINVLVKSKYCFLKKIRKNLTPTQQIRLKEVLQYDLKSVRAYLLKESFQLLWHYKSPYWAQWYLKKWCTRAMRSRLKPIKRFVRSVRKHEPLHPQLVSGQKGLFLRHCGGL